MTLQDANENTPKRSFFLRKWPFAAGERESKNIFESWSLLLNGSGYGRSLVQYVSWLISIKKRNEEQKINSRTYYT